MRLVAAQPVRPPGPLGAIRRLHSDKSAAMSYMTMVFMNLTVRKSRHISVSTRLNLGGNREIGAEETEILRHGCVGVKAIFHQ